MKPITRLLTAAALLAMGLISACTIDSADEFYRDVSVNFSGFYENETTGKIVSNNSGNSITSLDLRQTGDSLEAVDNNGRIWRGNLGEVQDSTSSFELNGQTTAGREGTFSGTLSGSGTAGTMKGTYIESDRFGTFSATATIPGSTDGGDDGGGGSVSISPPSSTLSSNGLTQVFTATGGSGDYRWSLSAESRGTLDRSSGSSVTYTRLTSGNNTISVEDAQNTSSDSEVTISQP